MIKWFGSLQRTMNAKPELLASTVAAGLSASLGLTPFALGVISPGLYRASFYAQVVQVAPISSSIAVGFAWTSDGVSQSTTGAAQTGNTLTSHLSGTLVLRSDVFTPISYQTIYASSPELGAPLMQYRLHVTLESVDLETVRKADDSEVLTVGVGGQLEGILEEGGG